MTDSSPRDDALDPRFYLSSRLPVAWRATPELGPGELTALNDSNVSLFNALALLDASNAHEGEEGGLVHAELARLETRLTLLLSMMSRLMAQQQLVPALSVVTLADHFLEWPEAPWRPGERGVVDLYIDVTIAMPLQLPVVITSDGRAAFDGLGPHCLNGLEKFLFRQHRRSIAEHKLLRS